jgi:hypothetical protein
MSFVPQINDDRNEAKAEREAQLRAARDARDHWAEAALALDDPKALFLSYGPAASAMYDVGQRLRAAVLEFDETTRDLYGDVIDPASARTCRAAGGDCDGPMHPGPCQDIDDLIEAELTAALAGERGDVP